MRIRKATKKDLKKIANIMRIEYGKPPYNEKWSKESSLIIIKKYFKRHVIFVLEIEKIVEGFIIGRITLEDYGNQGYVSELIVSNKSQGKGYGKSLIKKFEQYSEKNKARKIGLMANQKAKAFKIYKKLGFKKLGDFAYMSKKIK